MKK
ncbi:Protein of unknown function [Bacillus toyonensis]|jgi:putative glutathione S-transferase